MNSGCAGVPAGIPGDAAPRRVRVSPERVSTLAWNYSSLRDSAASRLRTLLVFRSAPSHPARPRQRERPERPRSGLPRNRNHDRGT
ncbi:MAG: hypothetical protein OXG81_00990 [Acidobacteria bacterium]|nr:hypothetical protein [Acidobacteriota bacterium]